MKNGNLLNVKIFRKRKFWPQFLWLLVLAVFGGLSCLFNSVSLLVASILAAFLGLNETGRWSYKTNLLICTISAVVGSICGVFSWFETASVFVLLFTVGGFMLYYRDSANRLLPVMDELAARLSQCENMESLISLSVAEIGSMSSSNEVFIILTDGEGGLYIPNTETSPGRAMKKNGSSMWKVFSSGRPYSTGSAEVSKDQPISRDSNSIAAVPLYACGDKMGVLQMESSEIGAFSHEDLSSLGIIAFVVSQPLHKFLFFEECVAETAEETR